jgi:uncharacterized protein YegP (UPF0339 family)
MFIHKREKRKGYRWEIFRGADGWYSNYVAPNNEIVFTTEGRKNEVDALEQLSYASRLRMLTAPIIWVNKP